MDKEQEFALNMRAYKPEVYNDMSDRELRELSCTLRMAIRLQIPGTVSTIVPMAIVMDIWGDMLQPMTKEERWEFASRVECEREFGHHTDHSDCQRIIWEMNHGANDAYEAYYGGLNREAEEAMLGRPLFPNEY